MAYSLWFKNTYDFVLLYYQKIENFNVSAKHTIGQEIKSKSMAYLLLVQKAYHSPEDTNLLHQSRELLREVVLLHRLCYDLKLISYSFFISSSELLKTKH